MCACMHVGWYFRMVTFRSSRARGLGALPEVRRHREQGAVAAAQDDRRAALGLGGASCGQLSKSRSGSMGPASRDLELFKGHVGFR